MKPTKAALYNGQMVAGGLLVRESRIVAKLLLDGVDEEGLADHLFRDNPSISGEWFAKSQSSFYADSVDAVFKALGVE